MKIRFIQFAIMIIIAAALNPLIAWGCLFLQHRYGWDSVDHYAKNLDRVHRIWEEEFGPSEYVPWHDEDGDGITMWPASHWDGTSKYLVTAYISRYPGFDGTLIKDELRESGEPRTLTIWLCDAGWPARCLTCRTIGRLGLRDTLCDQWQVVATDHGGYRTAVILPLRPLWNGVAINMVAYLLVLLTMRAAFIQLVRRRRHKRGLCRRCGYDLRGSRGGVCPECGTRSA